MLKLKCSDGTIITEQKDILEEQQQFYSELYAVDKDIKFQMVNNTHCYLTPAQVEALDLPLSIEELHTAVFTMKDNKASGTDGLPIEFYKMFWNELKDKLLLL